MCEVERRWVSVGGWGIEVEECELGVCEEVGYVETLSRRGSGITLSMKIRIRTTATLKSYHHGQLSLWTTTTMDNSHHGQLPPVSWSTLEALTEKTVHLQELVMVFKVAVNNIVDIIHFDHCPVKCERTM